MSNEHPTPERTGPEHGPDASAEVFDREISVRSILWAGFGLALLSAVAMILMWVLAGSLRDAEKAADRPPSPLPEANVRTLPPGPRLQGAPGSAFEAKPGAPELELRQLRAEEERILGHYGWVNEEGGIARIPVERAMAILAERGLGAVKPAGEPSETATTATTEAGAENATENP